MEMLSGDGKLLGLLCLTLAFGASPVLAGCCGATPGDTGDTSDKRPHAVAATFPDFQREPRWSAFVTLLVMNGRVVHKVFSRAAVPAPAY